MKKLTISVMVASALMVGFSGCAQKTVKTFGSSAIKEMNYSQFEKEFIVGKTTSDEAKARLGKPDSENEMGGVNWLTWMNGTSVGESNGLGGVPIVGVFMGKMNSSVKYKTASLGFDKNGILVNKKWDGEQEQEMGLKGVLAK